MDIHRSRFIPYPASAITALAFSHTSKRTNPRGELQKIDPTCLRLAIGRANGNIELWDPAKGSWIHERTLFGGKDRSVEGLVWIQEQNETDEHGNKVPGQLRLFSIGYSHYVTEWDLLSGLPKRHYGAHSSDVWCIATQPRLLISKQKAISQNPVTEADESQDIVVGCADGTLIILYTKDHDLCLGRFLSRSSTRKARTLSVTYQTRDVVVAGFADGTVGVFNARTGYQVRRIVLGVGPKGAPKDILVWTVAALPNGDIVVGDSSGCVRFYDGKNYSQLQQITAHQADVLALAVAPVSGLVFSGSMDRKSAAFSMTGRDRGARKWSKLTHKRFHEHDVKAMAAYDGNISIVVSGGIDVSPIVVPMREFGRQYHYALPLLPQQPPLASAPSSRLVLSWWEREAKVWQFPPKGFDKGQRPRMLFQLHLRGDENIKCASIDDSGTFISLATAAGTRIFQLIRKSDGEIRARKLSGGELPGARLIKFSTGGKWLAMVTDDNTVQLARILPSSKDDGLHSILPVAVHLERRERKITLKDGLHGSWGNYSRAITQMDFSQNGRVLVVADLAGYSDTWLLQGHEDPTAADVEVPTRVSALNGHEDDSDDEEDIQSELIVKGQTWKLKLEALLPKFDSQPLILSFRPSSDLSKPEPNGNPAVHPTRNTPHPRPHSNIPEDDEYRLFVVTATHNLYELDALSGQLTKWSKRNPTSSLPAEFRALKERAMGCVWDVNKSHDRLWLYGSNWLFMINLGQDLDVMAGGDTTEQHLKRKRFEETIDIQKQSTGAGDRRRDSEVRGLARKLRKITDAGDKMTNEIVDDEERIRARIEAASAEDDIKLADLPALRYDTLEPVKDEAALDSKKPENGLVTTQQRSWWYTLKYRPILGVVPIGVEDSSEGNKEVVLVERPLWDLDLPPKFVGPHERQR
jgi:U3 small nucleolar RNA-associated protein 4